MQIALLTSATIGPCPPHVRTLVFNKAARGDAHGTLERISRCVEVYELYPGLCRCMMRW